MSKDCFGCRSLLTLTRSDRVPVYLEPMVLPQGFRGRERIAGQAYCCLACGTYWVDATPTAAMLPRFRMLSAITAATQPAERSTRVPAHEEVLAAGAVATSQQLNVS